MSRFPFPFPLEEKDILRSRAFILMQLLASDEGFSRIPSGLPDRKTLTRMLALYDDLFFSGFLSKKAPALIVTLSSRLISSAGKFVYTRGPFGRILHAEIRMSSDFLTRLSEGPFLLNGLSVATAQEAFLVVFEHELCHAAEALIYKSTGHSERFLQLANGLFGHTGTRHSLPTRRQDAAQNGVYIGSQVSFAYKNTILQGFISYIGKTASVMVPSPSGSYRDRHGQRYEKYRVPLQELTLHQNSLPHP